MKEGWEYKKLGTVADFYRGLTYKREDEVDSSDNCVLRSNNIDLESMSLNFDELKYIRPDFVIPEDKKLKANSVFVCMSNGSKQHVGKVAYVNEDMNYAFGGFMGLIVPKPQAMGKYIYYVCRSSFYRHFLEQIGNGIGITNLRFTDLNEFSIPFPPLTEQQQIVEELDLLSSIIEKKKAQLNELDNLAQSLFYEMFGDPITNEKAWEVKKLESLLSNIKYGTGTPPQFSEQGFKFIRATNIKGGYIREDNMLYISPKEAAKIEKCKLQKNDMIVVRSGVNAGDVCRISEEYEGQYAGYDIIITINSVFANTVYLNLLMNNRDYVEEIIKPLTRRAAQPHLNAQQVKSFTIPLPPLVLQQQFASKIEVIEHQKELIKQSIKEVETLFNSRMDYYFN